MGSWNSKLRVPDDGCENLMEKYLSCVNSMKKGLSEVGGECLEEKDAYRKCVRKFKEQKK
eukprot:CAMPEP_0114497916 /NCGR_PEP_ID=MMETSP0109-20121206/6591_1 /TAXON_ID=29199 /ORGANISM="Chlorarachnion reptans, Strain CCCM449" /LENGTH=59 /DNA_ID=CAMNT_0001675353 /DNA_START=117 /DNA_END=296 /DNA_ORIENTATION=+